MAALDFPKVYILPTHIPTDQLHDLEDQVPTLTYDITEAEVIVGKSSQKRRVLLDLRSRKLHTEEVVQGEVAQTGLEQSQIAEHSERPAKRRKIVTPLATNDAIEIDSSTESEDERHTALDEPTVQTSQTQQSTQSQDCSLSSPVITSSPLKTDSHSSAATSINDAPPKESVDTIKVVKLAWLTNSLAAGEVLPLREYLVYEGRLLDNPESHSNVTAPTTQVAHSTTSSPDPEGILERAMRDAPKTSPSSFGKYVKHERTSQQARSSQTRPTHLLHETTSEHDDITKLPPVPAWLHSTYSCQRPTPTKSPNDPFLCELKKIKLWRKLTRDEIGVRAYSTSIATLAAYPYLISSAAEIKRLPGCSEKITDLYVEWRNTGRIREVDDIEANEKFQILNLFYEIWGCGEVKANEFYNKGYRELDDIVEHEWENLSRVQQIGVKYYDEFQDKIPRTEVESIAKRVLKHANKLHRGFQMCIVGGYRRGKTQSGDVDVVLTHPDESVTADFIDQIVSSLEESGWISHTLITTHANTERGQTPVAWKGDMKKAGTGFDTLDKSLLVWQNPIWPTQEEDLAANPKAKNPNIHRRVDIIISPWKTAGCAILGWTSGTTFQRDLRRYCKKVKGLKFDSSGIRSQIDGRWVDMESEGGDTLDLLEKEKRVFRALELEWREPTERCTG